MTKRMLTVCLAFISLLSKAQSTGTIAGKLTDTQNNPVEFANVVLLNSADSSLAKAALSDESGNFLFENLDAGNYLINATQIGFAPYSAVINFDGNNKQLLPITMQKGAVELKEANIVASKPLIERQVDKTVVNVENTIVNSGTTAIDILKRSPGITVDQDGNISLKGKQGVLVMIDGKPTYLSAADLYTMLKNMRSDELSRIEIITNPSAKYDAAGNSGIINLKMRKKQNLGFNGSARASYGQGVYPDFGTGINLNYRNEKFNVFGNYDRGKSFYYEDTRLIRRFRETDYTSTFDQKSFEKTESDNNNARAGADFFLNGKHTIGVLGKVNFNNNDGSNTSTTQISNLVATPDSGYTTINKNNSEWNNYSININHQFAIDTTGRELTTDIDYAHYNTKRDFNFITNYFSANKAYIPYTEKERNNQPAEISIQSAKIDYTQTIFKKFKLETGLKSSYVSTDNDVKYFWVVDEKDIADTNRSNRFKYNENINAAYTSLQTEKGKWGFQLGLRAEQTIAKGEQITTSENFKRDYIQLFPSAFVNFKLNDKNQFNAKYSRRIDRPEYQQLNPFRYFLDPKTFQQGNPDLEPQLTNSFELSHTFMDAVTTAIGYSNTTDAMTMVTKQIDSTRTTYVITENLNTNDNYSFSIDMPLPITKWWLMNNNFVLFNNRFKGTIEGGEFDERLTSYTFNTYHSFKLGNGYTFELSGYYNSKMVYATFIIDPQYSVSGGIAKSFFKERLNVKVNLNDIFNTEKTTARVKYNNVDFDFKQKQDSQFFRVHISYSFGKKTVQQARRRSGGAQDEQNRVKTN